MQAPGVVVGLLSAVALGACGDGARTAADASAPSAETRASAPEPSTSLDGDITVFAAASLTDAFEALGQRFEAAHPHVDVALNVGSSSTLATQIVHGAPADVFASADGRQMAVVADAGLLAGAPTVFAANALQIVVETGNPLGIERLDDLARDDVTAVLAADQVPAGDYARRVLRAQGIDVEPASLETDVRAVLSRVALGEADAGIVYASDVVAAGGDVDGVDIPADENVTATYPIAALDDTAHPEVSSAFVGYVTSIDGRAVLRDHGFTSP